MRRHTVGVTHARFPRAASVCQLDGPLLPQLIDNTLDLGSSVIAGEGAVLVQVPFYLQRDYGSRIMVEFFHPGRDVIRRYFYLDSPDDLSSGAYLTYRMEPLWAIPEGDNYTVSYSVVDRADNRSSSETVTPVKVINTPAAPSASVGRTSLYGAYASGLVDSWVLAQDYTSRGALLQPLGTSSINALLGFYQNSSGQPFLQLQCKDGTNWGYPSGFIVQPTKLSRGDLVLIKVDSASTQTVRLALTL